MAAAQYCLQSHDVLSYERKRSQSHIRAVASAFTRAFAAGSARPRGGFLASIEGRALFPHEPVGGGRIAQVVTVRRAEGSSRLAASFVNLQVASAAQCRATRCLDREDGNSVVGTGADGPGWAAEGSWGSAAN